jgi:hypothetical protein
MKLLRILLVAAFVVQPVRAATGGPSQSSIEKKYGERLQDVFSFQAKIELIHPIFKKVYPIAIVEDKTFYVFEPLPQKKTYQLVASAPDTFNTPRGVRAAMPLGFWDNRSACVVTGEIFDEPDGYVFIFHEFVHCAQWEGSEQKLKGGLSVYQEAMKKKDYMWELQFPFPYEDKAFIENYTAFVSACDQNDSARVQSLRTELKKALPAQAWEYMTWEEWKEGLARHLENRIRKAVGLLENTNGKNPPFNRVTFYYAGDRFISFLERQQAGIIGDLEKLYLLIGP